MLPVHTQKTLDALTWNEVQKLHSALGLKATATTRTRRDYQRRIVEAQPQPIAHTDISTPATFTCAQCPFARHIDGDRYCCQVSETAADVTRGHWEAKASCHQAIAQAKSTTKPEAPAPEEIPTEVELTPAVCSEESELPNRGDNGRGRIEPISQPVKIAALPHAAKPKADENLMASMTKESATEKEFYDLAYLSEQQMKAQLAVEKTVIGSEEEAIALLHLAKIDRDIEFYGRPQPEPQLSPVVVQLEKQMTKLKADVSSLFKITAFDPSILPTYDEPLDDQPATEIEPEGTIHWRTPIEGTIVGKKGATRQFYIRNDEIFIIINAGFTASETRHPNVRHQQIRDAINLGKTFNPLIFKLSPNFEQETEDYKSIGRIRQGCDGRWWAWSNSSTAVTGHHFFSRQFAEKYLEKIAERYQLARQTVACAK